MTPWLIIAGKSHDAQVKTTSARFIIFYYESTPVCSKDLYKLSANTSKKESYGYMLQPKAQAAARVITHSAAAT